MAFEPANQWFREHGRDYVVMEAMARREPFFLGLASASDHWFFCSSNGALSAGRRSPESALFPYETVDKIIGNWNTTGPWTAIKCGAALWEPMLPSIILPPTVRRTLRKAVTGDEVVFEEVREDLGLKFSYRWQLSHRFGFVRRARLENLTRQPVRLRLVDGLDNILPSGVGRRMQAELSCLADAYKISELECGGRLLVHRLAAGIIDQPIPLESLRATSVWTHGLGDGPCYLTRADATAFLRGDVPASHDLVRGRRGAWFLARELTLEPGTPVEWLMVADIERSQSDVSRLAAGLADPQALEAELAADVARGRERLAGLVAAADGIQESADRDATHHHYHNTLSNILRGGVPPEGYTVRRDRFAEHLSHHNSQLLERQKEWLRALPGSQTRSDLLAAAEATGDPDLARLAEEYLPLVLGRRHGDPSRPWNRFQIRLADNESGELAHYYEGNWRDIFQNWEALAWSYPDFLGAMIAKFVNASTIDGYNPYRLTSHGIDWEAPDESDPWASIGYWGDHQIIYLLKLLELQARIRPDYFSENFNRGRYVFADVPYRLKSWEDTLADPRNTIDFDAGHHRALMNRKESLGGDGLLRRGADKRPERVTLAEKLLLPAAVKLANLIPGAGIWMNTQRPEWNDANNALAGCGASVVTAAYLHRHLAFLEDTIAAHAGETLDLSAPLYELITALDGIFDDARWQQDAPLDASDRFALAAAAGQAAERHRTTVYEGTPSPPVSAEGKAILAFLARARAALRRTLRQNRRADGLYHAYRVLHLDRESRSIALADLPVMLEGQVAILSAGVLSPEEALVLLASLKSSDLFTGRHQTYLLYPDRCLPRFLESNRVATGDATAIDTLARMAESGDHRILVPEPAGGFRFHPSLTNGYALAGQLDALAAEPGGPGLPASERTAIEDLYERTFRHVSFTGRSGSMFGYEGLGCVYWHMVSKLMVAVQEVTLAAAADGAPPALVRGLTRAYYGIQAGIGFRQPPERYGAFPAEAYSHSPSHAGAQQPGLTGQVKEGILCRFGELGVGFRDGQVRFQPRLLRAAEFASPADAVRFTLARTPVIYHRREDLAGAEAVVHFQDGTAQSFDDATLDPDTTADLIRHTGRIARIEVAIPATWLIP
jgi:hypothetical protein